jgi:hypothetical protein
VSHRQCVGGLVFLWLTSLSGAADLQEIVRRGTAAIDSDWAADSDYSYVERDEVQKNGETTSKTYRVVAIDGSDYNLPLATDDEPLSPEQEGAELRKFRREIRRRNSESAEVRRQRIEKYKKQRDENGALLLEFPKSFTFGMLREETIRGLPAYVLSAAPKKRTGPMSAAVKVLAGMQGTLWIERNTFHMIHAECTVMNPVPVLGILARVLPGTHIALDLAPVSESVWLIRDLSLELKLSKLYLFGSTQVRRSTFSDYKLNAAAMEELVSKTKQSGLE